MIGAEHSHVLTRVEALPNHRMQVSWADAPDATIDLTRTLKAGPFHGLSDQAVFAQVRLGDWGHSVVWPGEIEMGADALWLDSLSAWGREDTRAFLEWRLRNGLSLNAAAEALGLSRRTIAYYSGGRAVPRSILLACKGWDALKAA